MCQLAQDTQGPIWSGKMRKDQSATENESERGGAERWIRAEELVFLSWQPFPTRRTRLSVVASSKGLENKTLLRCCQAAFKKKKLQTTLTILSGMWGCKSQESRELRFPLGPLCLGCVSHTARSERRSRGITQWTDMSYTTMFLTFGTFNHCH